VFFIFVSFIVIGRGGESIKRLQMESGCKIRIATESDGTMERSCHLTGSQESIDEAKRMIDDVVRRGLSRESNPGQGGQGGQGGGGGGFRRQYNNNGGGGGNGGGFGGQQQGNGGFRRY
jgi:far upstream element-binding protein